MVISTAFAASFVIAESVTIVNLPSSPHFVSPENNTFLVSEYLDLTFSMRYLTAAPPTASPEKVLTSPSNSSLLPYIIELPSFTLILVSATGSLYDSTVIRWFSYVLLFLSSLLIALMQKLPFSRSVGILNLNVAEPNPFVMTSFSSIVS